MIRNFLDFILGGQKLINSKLVKKIMSLLQYSELNMVSMYQFPPDITIIRILPL